MTFIEGTVAGDAAPRILTRGVWTYVEDTAVTRPRFWWDAAPEYRTFLAGPVASAETSNGLLTLERLHPGELAQVDLALVRLLSGLLAAALSVCGVALDPADPSPLTGVNGDQRSETAGCERD